VTQFTRAAEESKFMASKGSEVAVLLKGNGAATHTSFATRRDRECGVAGYRWRAWSSNNGRRGKNDFLGGQW
jgi:hypothetical protein